MNRTSRGAGPPIRISATGTITNPWHSLPPRVFQVTDGIEREKESWKITQPCRVDLNEHCLSLFFQNDEIDFVFFGDSDAPRYLVDPLRHFLCYCTFINYNLIGFVARDFDPKAFQLADIISFKTAHSAINVPASSLTDYLRCMDETLYYAIAFYLIGCKNPMYFLVEYYKAVEAIENRLGGERPCMDTLAPYGLDKDGYKKFKKTCNDTRQAPVAIGRHAPMPNAPLYTMDLQNLFSEPRSREIFEVSTRACRQVIDGYMAFSQGKKSLPINPL